MAKKQTPPEVPMQNAQPTPTPEPKKKSCWKIGLGVVALLIILIITIALWATSGMTGVIDRQLKYLKNGDNAAAYSLTSKQFQESMTLEQFTAFVNQYPLLKNNEGHIFSNRKNESGLGTVEGVLTANDGAAISITYQLVKENDEWKILGFKLNSSGTDDQSNAQKESNTGITKMLGIKLNETVGTRGIVEVGKSSFATTTPEINASVYIENARKGTKVAAQLTHKETGGKVGPAYSDITDDGTAAYNFTFSKPTTGWPAGEYTIDTEISTGESGSIDFIVE